MVGIGAVKQTSWFVRSENIKVCSYGQSYHKQFEYIVDCTGTRENWVRVGTYIGGKSRSKSKEVFIGNVCIFIYRERKH